MADGLKVEREGRVLVVTIDRQDRMNALSQDVHDGLRETWEGLKTDRSIRAIVIIGAGERAFCTGMDLQDAVDRGLRPIDPNVHQELRQTPMHCGVWLPTIVAVNGVCAGAGFHFVADADVVVGSTRASFTDTHVNVGQVTAVEPLTLAPRIGMGNALRLAVLGRELRIKADEALRISLIDEIVEPDQLLERAVALAEMSTKGSPTAIESSKRAIYSLYDRPLNEALQLGWDLLLAHRDHPDAKEGPLAFVERREPRWQ